MLAVVNTAAFLLRGREGCAQQLFCLSGDRRGAVGGEGEGQAGWKTTGPLSASEGNRVSLRYRMENTQL